MVWAQSFDLNDIMVWIHNKPAFGRQAVYLDSVDPTANPPIPRQTNAQLAALKAAGVQIIAPPIQALLAVDATGPVVPSPYALDINAAGLKIISWSFERVDLTRAGAGKGSYYGFDPTGVAIRRDSDMVKALDVLARQVKVMGFFSDWRAR
jgi:glycerophosphoryl diester phosphodiesterase